MPIPATGGCSDPLADASSAVHVRRHVSEVVTTCERSGPYTVAHSKLHEHVLGARTDRLAADVKALGNLPLREALLDHQGGARRRSPGVRA